MQLYSKKLFSDVFNFNIFMSTHEIHKNQYLMGIPTYTVRTLDIAIT